MMQRFIILRACFFLMRRIFQFMIFFFVFLSVYYSINFYIFFRLSSLLGMRRNIIFYIIIAIAALSYLVAAYLTRVHSREWTRFLYILSSIWMGVVFLLFSVLILFEIVNIFFPVPYAGYIILFLGFVLSLAALSNALGFEVKRVNIPLGKDITILQWSDVHLGSMNTGRYFKKLVARSNALNPDILVITGDLVDGSAELKPHMFSELNILKMPVYFVTGNHELYEGVDKISETLSDTKVRILRNETVYIKGIQLVGMDYSQNYADNIPATKGTSVLLYHAPSGLEYAQKSGISLQLSGHTHNGQITPFNLLVKLFFPYIKGVYKRGNTYLYVSQGTGTWGPPMRLGSRNEITLFDLSKG
jgi:predicted MPP superfamily phosphohydrolase